MLGQVIFHFHEVAHALNLTIYVILFVLVFVVFTPLDLALFLLHFLHFMTQSRVFRYQMLHVPRPVISHLVVQMVRVALQLIQWREIVSVKLGFRVLKHCQLRLQLTILFANLYRYHFHSTLRLTLTFLI